MHKAFKYRIYPTKEQSQKIDQTINACRLVYNLGLQVKISAWRSMNKSVSAFDLGKQIPELREAYPFIGDVNSQALYAALKNLDHAYRKFFAGGGFPKFKSKHRSKLSFQCHNGLRKIDWEKSLLSIPKIWDIPIVLSKKFSGEIKTITISKTSTNKYYASVLIDDKTLLAARQSINSGTTIGIDLGIKSFAVTSDGNFYEANRFLQNSLNRLKCLQRRASKKKKGSNNRKKANKKVALLHEKITNQRTDYIHKITKQLICDNQAESFVIEDLGVAGMLKNSKLSKAIQDASWGEFARQMTYKSEWHGKNLIFINRFAPSSKRCSECGEINDDLTLAHREWTCQCGAHHDRDLNAAKNIKFFGLNSGVGSAGEPVESPTIVGAKKQENILI